MFLKIFRLTLLYSACVGFCDVAACAQSPNTPVGKTNINIAYLEYLVKAQVDSVRHAKGLPPLVSDSILYLSARDHAEYLTDKPGIGHFQKDARKKTPQDRADFYGAVNYLAGENVLSYPLEDTYIATARRMVKGWVNSPGHYRNIITNSYQITGVAIMPHRKNGNLIAVQVFARVLWQYVFVTNKSMFPYDTVHVRQETLTRNTFARTGAKEKLPWKLKPLNYQLTRQNKRWKASALKKLMIRAGYSGDIIYAHSKTPKVLLKTMRRRRDGIAVEIVDYEPFHCGNPGYYTALSRRNGNSSINGQIFKPVYKRELLSDLRGQKKLFKTQKRMEVKQLKTQRRRLWFHFSSEARKEKRSLTASVHTVRRRQWGPKQTTVPVGNWQMADSGNYVVANFLLLHKRRIVAPLYFTDVCGDLRFNDTIQPQTYFSQPKIELKTEQKIFDFRIPFARNHATPDLAVLRAIKDTLVNYEIDSIQITAFASVEGLDKRNEKLYQTRGYNIVSGLRTYMNAGVRIHVQTEENWPMFYKQLKNTPFDFWRNGTQAEIKKELEKPEVLNFWEKQLDEQRNAHVYVKAHTVLRDTLSHLRQHYRLDKPAEAATLQDYHYQLWSQNRLSAQLLLALEFPFKKEYARLAANRLALEYKLHAKNWNDSLLKLHWEDTKSWLRVKGVGTEIRYHALFVKLTHWESIPYGEKETKKLLKQVSADKRFRSQESKLTAIFHLKNSPRTSEPEEGLDYLYGYYRGKSQIVEDSTKTLDLANFFIQMDQIQHASNILNDYLSQTGFAVEIYRQFLKIAFVHPDYQKNREYTNLLTEARQKLSREQWCDLFVGQCRINFQIFDDEELRNLYCQECADLGNEAVRNRNKSVPVR
jgi:uncharacterized protein YkwD